MERTHFGDDEVAVVERGAPDADENVVVAWRRHFCTLIELRFVRD